MINMTGRYWLFIIVMVLSLSGCTVPRPPDSAMDIQVGVPTVAPASAATGTAGDASSGFQNPARIFIEPASQQVAPNGLTTAEVWVENVTNLAGLDIELRFDPAFLRVIDAAPSQEGIQIQPGDFLSPDFVQTNDANNETGVIRFIMTQVAPTPPANGSGIILLITFEAIVPGVSNIDFSTVQLVNVDAVLIPLGALQSGQIVVTTEPVAEATATTVSATEQAALPTSTPQTADTPAATATQVVEQPAGATAIPQPTEPSQPDQPVAESPVVPPPAALPTEIVPDAGGISGVPVPEPLAIVQPLDIPPGATKGFCYRAQPGENIYALAQKYATTPWAINLVNDLAPPYYVYPQLTVFIPSSQPIYGPNIYLVEPYDTLASIAEQCKLPVKMLIRVNNLDIFIKRNHLDPNGPVVTLPAGATFKRGDGFTVVLEKDTVLVKALIIPIPPFPPPTRYGYPAFPIVPVP